MDKHIKKAIRKLVKPLPEMIHQKETVERIVFGSTLIDHGVVNTKDGQIIEPGRRYSTTVKAPVNHQTNAEKEFKRGGMDAVVFYCAQMQQIAANSQN